ncbi:S41 family peptidase [Bacillus sp. FJAT-45350]|uniref:S41 family peptidase n=1 Tax=Bacillus sp. FJAT-45350 TaxID=2011014 RepID=UPI000BB87B71|nr:S41 family peptidase [Bacillus sp. FJAT-45350]
MNGRVVALIVFLAFFIGAGGMYAGMSYVDGGLFNQNDPVASAPTGEVEPDNDDAIAKFSKAFQLISDRYVEDVDHQDLLEGAIEGMLKSLDDPYSVYMDQETASQFMESLDSHFEGIGAEVSMTNGQVTIVAPFRDSPAEKAGLQPNDRILQIDGESIEGLSLYEAVLQIRGEKGTIVELTIERPGASDPIMIDVTRDEIPIETVRAEVVEDNGVSIGVLEITSFSEDTAERFTKELQELEKQGIEGLVIDVRGNPGGYLNSVEDIGKLIIPGGKPVVQIENREGEKMRVLSSLKETKPYPIVGLIDRGSASASEILAAALKEGGGYDVVGETSFGKGTVQQAIKLGDGSEIKLTLFKWLTTDGNFINQEGVEPTIEVLQPDYFYLPPLNVKEEALSFDMNSEQVKNAQMMLKGIGLEPGRTDGYYGEQTAQAVRAFQQTEGLSVTGEIDEETAAALHQKIMTFVRDKKNDRQFNTAIELVKQQLN